MFCELWVCADCLFAIANGDYPDDQKRASHMQECINKAGFLSAGDSENDREFSWSACELCGEWRGGSRHQVYEDTRTTKGADDKAKLVQFVPLSLDAFCKLHNISPAQYGKDALLVFFADLPEDASAKAEMWHLSDYVVSSAVSGPAYVLVPRI